MAQNTTHLERFAPAILASTSAEPLADPILRRALSLSERQGLEEVYAPFEHIALGARLVIVGITPGLSQANLALSAVRTHLRAGVGPTEALRLAKLTASFSGGAMRSNLVAMLDDIGVQRLFGMSTTAALFAPGGEQVHFTSALRNPVFVNGANYNGTPDMIRTADLRQAMEDGLTEEIRALPDAIWLPLGPKPAAALKHLVVAGHLSAAKVLDGMPHPSGANAERVAAFLGRKRAEDASRVTNVPLILAARAGLARKIDILSKGAAA